MIVNKLKAILRHKKYKLYTRPYELNLVGLRSASTKANSFDDELHVFYKINDTHWKTHLYKITTDPGTYWLSNPSMPKGTAILAEGQYIDSHTIGLHRNQYTALVQTKPLTVIRDYDRDAVLDFQNGKKETGLFGINIHRAYRRGTAVHVDNTSAGCQVFASTEEFNSFMALCKRHEKIYGNRFTYTLIDFRALQREKRRRLVVGAGITASLLSIGYFLVADHSSIEKWITNFKKIIATKKK